MSTTKQYESIGSGDSTIKDSKKTQYESIESRESTFTDRLPNGLKNVHKIVLRYIGIVYGTAGFLIISSLLLLLLAFALQGLAKHPDGSSTPLILVGPEECRNNLSKCYESSNTSSDRNLCMALFKQCTENASRKVLPISKVKRSTELVQVDNNNKIRNEDSKCSLDFKNCLIEAAEADKRIRKYYFEGCLDNLKSCMKHENLGGKIGTCLAITGICIAGTFYIPPEAVFVCSGVAATCAGYTFFSAFF